MASTGAETTDPNMMGGSAVCTHARTYVGRLCAWARTRMRMHAHIAHACMHTCWQVVPLSSGAGPAGGIAAGATATGDLANPAASSMAGVPAAGAVSTVGGLPQAGGATSTIGNIGANPASSGVNGASMRMHLPCTCTHVCARVAGALGANTGTGLASGTIPGSGLAPNTISTMGKPADVTSTKPLSPVPRYKRATKSRASDTGPATPRPSEGSDATATATGTTTGGNDAYSRSMAAVIREAAAGAAAAGLEAMSASAKPSGSASTLAGSGMIGSGMVGSGMASTGAETTDPNMMGGSAVCTHARTLTLFELA